MRKKVIIYGNVSNFEDAVIVDNFSLKKIVKSVGNAVGDAAKSVAKTTTNVVSDATKLGLQPVKLAVASVTGKPVNTSYSTGIGKIVGAIHDTGSKALTATAKGFADTITGGLATKAANLLRKDENKEKAFSYNEMKPGAATGVKFIDKVGAILPTTGAIVGGTAAGIFAGNKALGGSKQTASNQKPTGVSTGSNVLDQQLPLNTDISLSPPNNNLPGGLPSSVNNNTGSNIKTASFSFPEMSPMLMVGIVIAVILLALAVRTKE